MMMSGMCTSVQASLDDLFAQIHGSPVRVRACSDRAFAKARRGFSAQLFEHLNGELLDLAQPLIQTYQWNGLRVVAADGSRLQVSTRRGAHLDADHYAFALYLPGAELTLHAALHPSDGSERQMLFEALDATGADDLLVLDRGLIGGTMAAILSQRQRHFCMRVDHSRWACVRDFLHSGDAHTTVTLPAPKPADAALYELQPQPTRVRLIRDVTPSGSVRALMTSLLDDARYPAATFGALYHQRWRIEEAFKRIKHRLRLEASTGLTHLAFQQDFAAKVLADNLHSLLCQLADAEPFAASAAPSDSRPNRTYAFGTLKPILAGCLLRLAKPLLALRDAILAITQTRCGVTPARSYPRPNRTKPHTYAAYKLCC